MANNFFRFKQFIVYQNEAIMPISTDACVLGSMVSVQQAPAKILDIGTGSGVLSLMMAQKFENAKITALDINEDAITQAQLNFADSIFANRCEAIYGDVVSIVLDTKFDFIICNPPYFKNSLQATSSNINIAKHSTALTLNQLAIAIKNLLSKKGNFSIIIPHPRVNEFMDIATENELFINEVIHMQHNKNKSFTTSIINGSLSTNASNNSKTQTNYFTLKNTNDTYTEQAVIALQPFYLNL